MQTTRQLGAAPVYSSDGATQSTATFRSRPFTDPAPLSPLLPTAEPSRALPVSLSSEPLPPSHSGTYTSPSQTREGFTNDWSGSLGEDPWGSAWVDPNKASLAVPENSTASTSFPVASEAIRLEMSAPAQDSDYTQVGGSEEAIFPDKKQAQGCSREDQFKAAYMGANIYGRLRTLPRPSRMTLMRNWMLWLPAARVTMTIPSSSASKISEPPRKCHG